MPSYTFDPVSVMSMNETEKAKFLADLLEGRHETQAPTKSAEQADPIGARPVVAQARRNVTAANSDGPSKLTYTKVKPFTRDSDRDAANAVRLALGSSAFRTVTHFGLNTFIPDFTLLFQALAALDFAMLSTDKFCRASEFWTPAVSRIYIAVICYVQVMRSMRATSTNFGVEIQQFLDWFEEHFPLNTLPVPGPLVNFISTISSCHISTLDYKVMCPILPRLVPCAANGRWVIHNNLSLRFPPVPTLFQQLSEHYNYANPAAAAPQTAEQIGRWADYGRTQYGITAWNANAATSQTHRTTLTALSNATHAYAWAAPGNSTPYRTNTSVGRNLIDYGMAMDSLIPPEFNSAAANGPAAANPTWQTYLGFETTHEWFPEFARIMSVYSKFWKESTSLDTISPVGSTACLAVAEATAQLVQPTTRYPALTLSRNFVVRISQLPEADLLDSQLSAIHCADTGTVTAHASTPNVNVSTGPYLDLAIQERARAVDASGGLRQIIEDYYHVQNPKA
ncbi:capsid protein [Heterobasidion partitivirus 13]|uniref:Capsid protein n=1 Tax=Heterobasidion partitivirus 13 TaxID=1469906 RepID=W8P6P0_9VIRU|nr:capsid protein [Heterobasidion partitivirus 13]AHL25154.1 capsid protein [Heterobasidion partitivirus 13]UNA06823.1 capsid protein [Heterobasidion partitivirus 13]